MKVLILYNKEDALKNREYIELFEGEFKKRDVDFAPVYTDELEKTELPDILINRARSLRAAYFFEERGVRVSNPPEITRLGNDKYYAYERAEEKGIAVMNTSLDPAKLPCPCVIKTLDGHGGSEVFLAADEERRLR